MADRLVTAPPGVAIGQAMGWIVLTWNGNQWQDDWDGNVHTTREAADKAFLDCRAAGWDAVLVWRVAEKPPSHHDGPTDEASTRAFGDQPTP